MSWLRQAVVMFAVPILMGLFVYALRLSPDAPDLSPLRFGAGVFSVTLLATGLQRLLESYMTQQPSIGVVYLSDRRED